MTTEANPTATPAFGGSVPAAEIYSAAREVCSRLYIANGGSSFDSWTVAPYPGTAAIAQERDWNTGGTRWALHMPALPLDARLSRREADVMVAYTVHELGHALFTDFAVMNIAAKEGLAHVLNGLEDIRIERDLVARKAATNARELLETLTEYTTLKSLASGWRWDNPASLPFSLFQLGAVELLGYSCPSIPPVSLPPAIAALMREAVARVARTSQGRTGTLETLNIARWLKGAIEALPKDKPGKAPSEPQDARQDERQDDGQDDSDTRPEASKTRQDDGQDADSQDADSQDADSQDDAKGEADKGEADDAAPGGARASQDDSQDKNEPEVSGAPGGVGGSDAWNPSDTGTVSPEVNLDDIGDRHCERDGTTQEAQAQENLGITDFLNAVPGRVSRRMRLRPIPGEAESIAGAIATPAKLRRDVTKALRAPDTLDNLRREGRGRFDMRDATRANAGAVNVFRRRQEAPGQAVAVTLLIDMSSSMMGRGIQSAAALALHLGDACAACSVPFEVLGFTQPGNTRHHGTPPQSGILEAKAFRDPWQEAKPYVAAMVSAVHGGTAMMPAMNDVAKRLAKRSGVTRRVMIVLTDGEDGYPVQSIRAAAKNALARHNVETVMIGAGTDVARLGLPFVNVRNLRDVARDGLTALSKALRA